MSHDYNSQREDLVLPEYGRNIQRMARYVAQLEDKEKRTAHAYTLVELMKQLNPDLKNNPETLQKVWDDMHIMADFKLDIEGPYPAPSEEVLTKKPNKVDYKNDNIRFKHYGNNLEKLVKAIAEREDSDKREEEIIFLGKMMKHFYRTWNKEVSDKVIVENMAQLSDGVLKIDPEKVEKENLFELSKPQSYERQQNNQRSGGKGNNQRRNRRNKGGKYRKKNK